MTLNIYTVDNIIIEQLQILVNNQEYCILNYIIPILPFIYEKSFTDHQQFVQLASQILYPLNMNLLCKFIQLNKKGEHYVLVQSIFIDIAQIASESS